MHSTQSHLNPHRTTTMTVTRIPLLLLAILSLTLVSSVLSTPLIGPARVTRRRLTTDRQGDEQLSFGDRQLTATTEAETETETEVEAEGSSMPVDIPIVGTETEAPTETDPVTLLESPEPSMMLSTMPLPSTSPEGTMFVDVAPSGMPEPSMIMTSTDPMVTESSTPELSGPQQPEVSAIMSEGPEPSAAITVIDEPKGTNEMDDTKDSTDVSMPPMMTSDTLPVASMEPVPEVSSTSIPTSVVPPIEEPEPESTDDSVIEPSVSAPVVTPVNQEDSSMPPFTPLPSVSTIMPSLSFTTPEPQETDLDRIPPVTEAGPEETVEDSDDDESDSDDGAEVSAAPPVIPSPSIIPIPVASVSVEAEVSATPPVISSPSIIPIPVASVSVEAEASTMPGTSDIPTSTEEPREFPVDTTPVPTLGPDTEESETTDPTVPETGTGTEEPVTPTTTPGVVLPPVLAVGSEEPSMEAEATNESIIDATTEATAIPSPSVSGPVVLPGAGSSAEEASDEPSASPDEEGGEVCVEATYLESKGYAMNDLVHSSAHIISDVLCPADALASLPCATAQHMVRVNNVALSYKQLCDRDDVVCNKKQNVAVNSVLSHQWVEEEHVNKVQGNKNNNNDDVVVKLTMFDVRHPTFIQVNLHRLIHLKRSLLG